MIKKFRRITACILICLAACVCAVLSSCAKKAVPLLGVWWWKDSLGDEYLNFAKSNNVTEIYYCSSKFNQKTDEFIAKAQGKNIKVYWLAGEKEWIKDPASCKKQIEKYKAYQGAYSHRFSGIHFDVEPHQYSGFKANREQLLTLYVEFTYDLAQSYPDLWIEYDIPFWLNDEITLNGVKKPAYMHVMDNASRVTLMSYRDTAEAIYNISSEEIAYAGQLGKPLNLGVETYSEEGKHVSFMEDGKNVMYAEIAKLRKMIPSNYGVVIHQVEQWYNLKD